MEEVARQTVCSSAIGDEMRCLPKYISGTTTWLSILHRFEHLLQFDVLIGRGIEHRNGDKNAVEGTNENHVCSAVSSGYVMLAGAHYAEFQITGTPYVGIVRPMPGLDANAYKDEDKDDFSFIGVPSLKPDFLAQKSDDWGNGDVHACEYGSFTGEMSWTSWADEGDGVLGEHWEGMEGCTTGDILGMLLNLNKGTLAIYKNSRRLGVMKDGLSGPYCWYADLANRDTVTIKKARIRPVVVD